MLKDCLEIFQEELKRAERRTGDAERLILDQYIPADGDYLLVKKDGTVDCCSIKMDKKTRIVEKNSSDSELYEKICFYDYHSRLVSMDKPVDTKKVVHSNNYFSFWIKWESLGNGKLNIETIDRYYDALRNPKEKYKNKQDQQLYEYIEEQLGEVDQIALEENRTWVKKHIFSLDNLNLEYNKKNYLKIFFEADKESYLEEERRYLTVKIFNNNDYNVEIAHQIYGLPNDNLGLNVKKPFLKNRTRKVSTPYLISPEEAILQRKFFDYLMNKANAGETDIFLDFNEKRIIAKKKGEMPQAEFSGYFLGIQKGKELEIHHQDIVVSYHYFLKKPFIYKNILGAEDNKEQYKEYTSCKELQSLLNEVFFSKFLITNYFSPVDEIPVEGTLKQNLLLSREQIFAWLYKGNGNGIDKILEKVGKNMAKYSILNGYCNKAKEQMNLLCSFEEYFGGGNMGARYDDIRNGLREKINSIEYSEIESDEEYFYAVGQLVYYFISLSKTKGKTFALVNPFLNVTDDAVIRTRLKQYFMKYNYQIDLNSKRFQQMYEMVFNYMVENTVNTEAIMLGFVSDCLIYEKMNKEQEAV